MTEITGTKNDKVKEYVRLSAKASERTSSELFVFEGVKLLAEAYTSGINIKRIFVTADCLSRYSAYIKEANDNCSEVYSVTQSVADKLALTRQPQGVFTVAGILEQKLSIEAIYKNGRYLLLNRISDPGNLGTIIRGAEAMGLEGVILTADCCDIYSFKVIRASMGSSFRVPFLIIEDAAEFLSEISSHSITTYAAVLDETAISVLDCKFPKNCVLCLGNEGDGLSANIIDACTDKVTIKMRGRAESLNVAAAAQIFMWEMCR